MKDVFQGIGVILATIIVIVGYIFAIARYKSSKQDKNAEARLFEGLTETSAIAMCILLIFGGISSIF